MKKLFGNLRMRWPSVILFALIAGVYTGAVMLVPVLKNTSFQDIGISYEMWVIFAVIVTANCRKGWEAMLKCFVFFLISQPLVYIVEAAFGLISFEKGWYYYRTIWLPATFLTLPGGYIAYFAKKQNIWGSIVLGLGNTIQAVLSVHYFGCAVKDFPHHLLSGIVCVASVIIMTLSLQSERKYRAVALLTPVLLTTVIVVYALSAGLYLF